MFEDIGHSAEARKTMAKFEIGVVEVFYLYSYSLAVAALLYCLL